MVNSEGGTTKTGLTYHCQFPQITCTVDKEDKKSKKAHISLIILVLLGPSKHAYPDQLIEPWKDELPNCDEHLQHHRNMPIPISTSLTQKVNYLVDLPEHFKQSVIHRFTDAHVGSTYFNKQILTVLQSQFITFL